MRIKLNLSKSLSKLSKFVAENSETIVKIGGLVGLACLAKKYDIPITVSSDGVSVNNAGRRSAYQRFESELFESLPTDILAKNPKEAAILTYMDEGRRSTSNYYKGEYVEKIFEMANGDVEESTKMLAIHAIKSIAATSSSNYYRNEALDYISNLAIC